MLKLVDDSFQPQQLPLIREAMDAAEAVLLDIVQRCAVDGLSLEREEEIMALVGRIGKAMMAEALRATNMEAPRIKYDQKSWQRMAQVTVGTYGTIYGEVQVPRALYRQQDERNGPTIDVIALRSGIRDGFTPKARAAIGFSVQSAPVREAHALQQCTGTLPYSTSTFQRVADGLGEDVKALEGPAAELAMAWTPDALREAVAVVVEVDRASVPMSEPREPTPKDVKAGVTRPLNVAWRMAFCGAVMLVDRDGEVVDVVRMADIPSEGRAGVTQRLRERLESALRARPDLKVATLADGAAEMQAILADVTEGHEVHARLTDFFHLTEYLAAAVKSLGESADRTLTELNDNILGYRDGIDDVEAWLSEHRRRIGDGAPEPLVAAIRYIDNHRHLMGYAAARAAGLPIGSGSIEATCKTIIAVRMKRAGARWSEGGAQHVLQLRALAMSEARWRPMMGVLAQKFTYSPRVAA